MEILGKLLGNEARVKIMRLFLLNRSNGFTTKEIIKRSRVSPISARRELKLLASVNFVKKRTEDWIFNPTFKYGEEFKNLLLSSDSLSNQNILNYFKKVGKIKLLLTAGIFIKNPDSRVDLLIVGDGMRRSKIEEGIRKIEAEMGAELAYSVFDTKEFLYRLNMYDKLIRDILDFPHDVVLQSKDFSTQALKKI